MLRIISINLNGIRSAERKGFFVWLAQQNADVVCMQELKAQEADLVHPVFTLAGYHSYFHCAEKKGYSGVGIYTRVQPQTVVKGLGFATADQEGRYVAVHLGNVWVVSAFTCLPAHRAKNVRR